MPDLAEAIGFAVIVLGLGFLFGLGFWAAGLTLGVFDDDEEQR